MPKLPISYYGQPVLRETARPVERIAERHRKLAADMAETMYEARGIGLAANQVGLLERIIVVDVDWSDRKSKKEVQARNPIAMINPELIEESVEDDVYSEGCLSIPSIEGDVWRPVKIRYAYTDLSGKRIEETAEGLKARCIQHEIDHLNGTLFIDHLTPDARGKLAGKLTELRRKLGG
jgi:peptide deformylase